MQPTKVKSFRDIGALRGAMTTDFKAELLLKFIAQYRADHKAATPTYDAMANELEVPIEAVIILLARLEKRGDIHFISRSPPRIMLPGEEPAPASDGKMREGAYDRYLSAEATRMKLGRFIADCERVNQPVTLQLMMDHIGFQNREYVAQMAQILVDRGLLDPPAKAHAVPTKLSEKGREFFRASHHTQEPAMNDKSIIVVPMHGGPPRSQVFKFCETYAQHLRETGNYYVMYKDLAVKMGYSDNNSGAISSIVNECIKQGWLEPKQKYTRGLFFTDKGLRKFMPEEVVEEQMPEEFVPRDLEPEVTFEPDRVTSFGDVEDRDLVMELIERGYTVKKN